MGSESEAVSLKGTKDALELREGALWLGDKRAESVRYRFGRVHDEIEISGRAFTIPSGKGSSVQKLVLRSRLAPPGDYAASDVIETVDDPLGAWLATWLRADAPGEPSEIVLASLATSKEVRVTSPIAEEQTLRATFILTSRRAALVAVSSLGDVWLEELTEPIVVHAERGRDRIVSGAHEWLTSRTNEKRFVVVAPWSAAGESARLRLALDAALDAGHLAHAELVAERLGDARARVALWLRGQGSAAPPDAAVWDALHASIEDTAVAWAKRWQLSPEARWQLIAASREHSAESPLALALHESQMSSGTKQSHEEHADSQARWAEHLYSAGREADAAKVLEDALSALPDGDTMDLVPHGEVNEPNPLVHARVQLLETKRRLLNGAAHFDASLALARLEPLQLKRVMGLVEVAPLPLRDRASVVGSILSHGLECPGLRAPETEAPLTSDELALLHHPIGRTDEFLGMVSTVVASTERPDHSALRAYCPRLRDETRRAVFERVAKRLAVKAEVYVSGGDDSVGCFGHEDDASMFVVLGGHHIDESNPRFLTPVELAFAFGSELAHLRFGHSRVTSSALWKGAFDLGVSGFDVLLSAVPVLGRYKIGDGISKIANAFKDGSAQKLGRRARKLLKFGETKETPDNGEEMASDVTEADVSTDDHADKRADQLIAAHRLMQLGADRAGLAMCGHPAPAIKAMLALDGGSALEDYRKHGLFAMATMRTSEGGLLHAELTLRICALLSFWLSDDYQTLADQA